MQTCECTHAQQATARAIQLTGERKLALTRIDEPPPPAADEIKVQIRIVALNHIDVWSWRGMAFAKRDLPIILGAEASGEVMAVGSAVKGLDVGDIVAFYGARTCGTCGPCREGRDNFCEGPRSMYGFNIDGFLRERMNIPARLAVKAPKTLDVISAACAPITFGTVEHMLFDNAKLKAGETILVQAGGSGIGTAAIQLAKAVGATVITTVGSDEKVERVRALGADHVINYRRERFEGRVRKITNRKGVDVVFEHVGPDTWEGSILSLARGGRLVTCGSTTGVAAKTNLYLLFQQQLRLIGSFGCRMENMKNVMDRMARTHISPMIDSIISLDDVEEGLRRLEERKVFGKIIVKI
ncbi:alcohol dehydrogenase zinc-binding domain-containing protein [Hyphomicrobium denitrificans 1NES1]|uniref:Alcohol dehydrogenase zinc-binding domain-containing protein n=1 Tax=Hyphomicrobium denitrificans 1NES1 TaxID=670307 RepID=N0B9J1_9HYPH|nr:zinc-binding dehydrogenase [Hyphomicrobium denitrificans]AGK56755.1 alcohol dehydrogenase zinc-binding domain-containing protein [Hyphomicrobium denitrificans 1NES1]